MKVVKGAREKTGKDLYTDKYEFRACGGSIEPEDCKTTDKQSDEQKKA